MSSTSTTPNPTAGNLITLVEADDTFPWQFRDGNNIYDNVFTLRVVPDSVRKKFRREATSRKVKYGQEQERFDQEKYGAACLDYAIVDWTEMPISIKIRDAKGNVVRVDQIQAPCEAKYKNLLPERVKIEINRLCLGKEAGLRADEDDDEPEDVGQNEARGIADANGEARDPNP